VAIVGIDEKTFARFREPFALWHPHLGKFLRAMAVAQPSVVGLDVVLPDKSYQFLIPGYDQSLLAGLALLRGKVPVVLGRSLDDSGNYRELFPPYVSLAGQDNLASVAVCLDPDRAVRRHDNSACGQNLPMPTLAEKMAERLGIQASWRGHVDYAVGAPFEYQPLQTVLEWADAGEVGKLHAAFGGRPVLLGVVLPFEDRHRFPVPLAAWEPEARTLPGVLFHAQMLRSMLHQGLVQPLPDSVPLLLAAVASLFWFGRAGWIKLLLLFAASAGLLALGTFLLWKSRVLPVAGIVGAAVLAFAARLAYESVRHYREKRFLRANFSSYVSPPILREIMAGRLTPDLGGKRQRLCVLFSDIRNFTGRSEKLPPEAVITLLNDYFSEMAEAIHKHGGTLDKFIGDGIMAFFGAPATMPCPEKNALECAQEMLIRLEAVNRKLVSRGMEPVSIGIGLHSGDAVVGHVGSASRHEYTAIGDVVNTASRLEGVTKDIGHPVALSATVADAVGGAGGLVDVGMQSIKGHAPVQVFGWSPPVTVSN
jgi:class 3 adenylate cyclase